VTKKEENVAIIQKYDKFRKSNMNPSPKGHYFVPGNIATEA